MYSNNFVFSFFVILVLLKETTKLQSRSGTVTPPPSPTSGQSIAPARTVLDVEGLATGTSEVCTATLEVLAHLFSWIDLSSNISTNLLDAIFSCAKYYDAMVRFSRLHLYVLAERKIICPYFGRMANK